MQLKTNAPMESNKELELAWKFIKDTNVSMFLTGKAGTGKTTFLKKLRAEMPKRMVVVAPTGVAAINAGGVTIHSFFQLPIGIHVPDSKMKREKRYFTMSKTKKSILRTLDLLIIDEISMVRSDLLDAIDEMLRQHRDHSKPFGGVQLLMIGDLHQLAPVANDQEWDILKDYYDTQYFFGSKALQQVRYVTIELKKIYRQEDDHFIRLLSNIRDGHLDHTTINALNQRYIPNFQPPAQDEYIRLTTHNYRADQYNQQQLSMLPGMSRIFECVVEGTFPENSFPAAKSLELKLGTQVMFIRNDSGGERYFNGKIGKVVGFGDNRILVQGNNDPQPISVEMAEWENTEYEIDEKSKNIQEKVIGHFRQFPLRLAWSITVHKSQGLTFDHAILDINYSFAPGQVYVALSRCRSLEGLVLSNPLYVKSLATDKAVVEFIDKELSSAENTYSQFEELKTAYFHSLLDEQFGFSKLVSCVNDTTRVFNEFLFRKYADLAKAWMEISRDIETKLTGVAKKFRQQYVRLLSQNGEKLEDAHLQERIRKAADYFNTYLCSHLTGLVNRSRNLEIGNKQTLKRYENSFERLVLELRLKCYTLAQLAHHDFSVNAFLHDKALAVLPEEEFVKKSRSRSRSNTASQKPEKKKREPKGTTQRVSLEMFRSGMNYNEIAAERMLVPSTIFGHLRSFVETGDLKWEDIIIQEHITFVKKLFEREGTPDNISDYNKLLPKDICPNEYYHIAKMLLGED